MKLKVVIISIITVILISAILICTYFILNQSKNNPDDVLKTYMSCVINKDYEKMYELISEESKKEIEKDVYIARNKNIYEGIEISSLDINIIKTTKKQDDAEVIYNVTMKTLAGEISFSNTTNLIKDNNKEYKIKWSSNEIFPSLKNDYKVRVETIEATRGKILDRNGTILAGQQTASQIGLVPGKINNETKEQDIIKIAELLDVSTETINNSLSASYVKEDTFVPIRTIRKSEQQLKNQLLEIKGIKIIDTQERIYPLGEATSHLLGYIQSIGKEELEEKKNQGYNEQSIIGKSGLEKIYEERLRSINGAEIYINNNDGNKIKTLAKREAKNGEDIKLTIDSNIQEKIYEQFKQDKSASVAINPKTGEVLALISTPTFDSNDFSLGMTNNKWNQLSQDENKPFYNRYLASFAPGSSIKPIIGAIGLTTSSFTTDEDFGKSGLKWQINTSWGDFYITTLSTYSGKANLQNALIHSDNIYFAKAALRIGKDKLIDNLKNIGFGEQIEFTQEMTKSSYSNTGDFINETMIANSGYGQAEMLVNPIHMSMIYSSFVNNGNMITPYLEYKTEANPIYYKQQVFTNETANIIKEDLIQVVENANGTAHSVKIDGMTIAGKTGTAEIKTTKDDIEGTEIGWFDAFIADENSKQQFLIISMVEDVKHKGGSHYLLDKIKTVFQIF